MKSVIKSAKTVEEALALALEELKVNENDVDVEILEQPAKGLFGLIGQKDAKIKVVVNNDPEKIADKFVTELLEKMGIDARCKVLKIDNILKIDFYQISHSDLGLLIGKRGSTLDSIQYLISLVVNKNREEYLRVQLDAEGYREKREQTLMTLANKMAEKVKYSKRPMRLEPMNPYERRIIHSTLQDTPGISTYSEGEDPFRRVVIVAK